MPLNSDICPCDWDADFGADGESCDNQTPGADECMVFVCGNKIDLITKTPAVSTDPCGSGVITGVDIAVGQRGYRIIAKKDSINPNSGETVGDNNSIEIDENVPFQGSISTCNTNWLKNNLNKEGVLFVLDNDGKLWAFGWDGGGSIQSYNNQWGQQSGDFKGVDVQYINTTGSTACEVVPTAGTVTDFMDSLIA